MIVRRTRVMAIISRVWRVRARIQENIISTTSFAINMTREPKSKTCCVIQTANEPCKKNYRGKINGSGVKIRGSPLFRARYEGEFFSSSTTKRVLRKYRGCRRRPCIITYTRGTQQRQRTADRSLNRRHTI